MKKIILLSLVLLMMMAGTALAGKSTFGGSWNISLPTGDTNDFTSGVHFRGASLEWRNFYTRDTAYGLNVSWNVFNKSFNGTYTEDNFAVTGAAWRYVNAVPIYASWHKYTGGDRRGKRTFFGINGGMISVQRRVEMGIYQLTESEWMVGLAPEIGMQMPWDAFLGWMAVRYNYGFATGEFDAQQWVELRIGFGLN